MNDGNTQFIKDVLSILKMETKFNSIPEIIKQGFTAAEGKEAGEEAYRLNKILEKTTLPSFYCSSSRRIFKDAAGNYRFAVAQFTNQSNALFGQTGSKNGNSICL